MQLFTKNIYDIPPSDRPLVTFTLLCYNHERFIRQAVEGAFAQTYDPLEIILSDDCSTDATYEIMQEMAAVYAGPHSVVLNRNPKNVGVGSHVATVMEMAKGELVIRANGDDISLPERTMALTEAWCASGRPAGIASAVIPVDEHGKMLAVKFETLSPIEQKGHTISPPELICLFLEEKPLGLMGCSAAWSKENWDWFGPFVEGAQQEDTMLSFRGFLRGRLCTIDRKLVKYRAHEQNLTFVPSPRERKPPSFSTYKIQALNAATGARRRYAEFMTVRRDISTAKEKHAIDPRSLGDLEQRLNRRIEALSARKDWWRLGLLGRIWHWKYAPYPEWQQRIPSLVGINAFVWVRYCIVRIKGSRS